MRSLLAAMCLCLPVCAQDFTDYEVVKVATGYTFAEGPAWSRDGYLLFSDVPENRIWKLVPGEPPVLFREDSHGATGQKDQPTNQ